MSKDIEKIILSWKKRLSWDEYFISSALLIASRSSCDRLHVGCLLVKDNRIISAGYNGFLAGLPHESVVVNNHEQVCCHCCCCPYVRIGHPRLPNNLKKQNIACNSF